MSQISAPPSQPILSSSSPQPKPPQTLSSPSSQLNFFQQLTSFSLSKISRLPTTIFGDRSYKPKNTFKIRTKHKILTYLKAKSLTSQAQLQDHPPLKFTSYDPTYASHPTPQNLSHLKSTYLKLKTHIQSAQDNLHQQKLTQNLLQSNYFNQLAYQFNRQKLVSISWGLFLSSVICSTIYRRGTPIKKFALFLTLGHVFGQLSYYVNIDKFFDTVYPIFQSDQHQFTILQQQQQKIKNANIRPNRINIMEG